MIALLHPSEGKLRRIVDEPLLVADRVKVHVRSCRRCSARLRSFSAEVTEVRRLLPANPAVAVDVKASLARVQRRLSTAKPSPRRSIGERLPQRLTHPGRAGGIVAAIAVLGITTGTVTAVAGVQWTQIFAPTKVAPLAVTRSELLALPHLSEFGRLAGVEDLKLLPEPSLAAAESAAGVTLTMPSKLPSGVTGTPEYLEVPRYSSTFTFSAARAEAAALAAGVALPPLPAGFDGAQLRESVGPGIVVVYGIGEQSLPLSISDLLGGHHASHRDCSSGSACASPSPRSISDAKLPTLALLAVRAPVLESTGVSVSQLENYLLSLPFLPASLVTAIHQLGNPIDTLPIPILTNLGQSQPAKVHGQKAVLFAAGSPLVAAVVWEQTGVVRAIGGLVDSGTVLSLARG